MDNNIDTPEIETEQTKPTVNDCFQQFKASFPPSQFNEEDLRIVEASFYAGAGLIADMIINLTEEDVDEKATSDGFNLILSELQEHSDKAMADFEAMKKAQLEIIMPKDNLFDQKTALEAELDGDLDALEKVQDALD